MGTGLYIHIPFCKVKCGYCDFVSYAGKNCLIPAYIKAAEREFSLYPGLRGRFGTVYVGGGTPSVLSAVQLAELCGFIKKATGGLSGVKEYTFEVNPESFDEEKARVLYDNGVNRLSMGLQTADPLLLKKIGRISGPDDFFRAFASARKTGFKNISADLMCGLPGQSVEDFRKSADILLRLGPEHISLYPLEVHGDTPLGRAGIKEDDEASADMYEEALRLFPEAGYRRYEISNFARPGYEAEHNLNYWLQGEYLGIGAGAASFLSGRRFTNTGDVEKYISAASAGLMPGRSSDETVTGRAALSEKLILGLRLVSGIEITYNILKEFGGPLRKLEKEGLLEFYGNRIRIRKDKFYLANKVFIELL